MHEIVGTWDARWRVGLVVLNGWFEDLGLVDKRPMIAQDALIHVERNLCCRRHDVSSGVSVCVVLECALLSSVYQDSEPSAFFGNFVFQNYSQQSPGIVTRRYDEIERKIRDRLDGDSWDEAKVCNG